jgi:biotin synthase
LNSTAEIYAKEAKRLDFKTVVLQSGEDPAYSTEDLCTLVQRMKKDLNLAVTLCIGERADIYTIKKVGI